MITVKSAEEIVLMRKANVIVRDTLAMLEDKIKPGISTKQIDKLVYEYIVKCDAVPSFLGFEGFPASACVSIDEEVVHGIPSARRFLEEGQLVSVDVGSIYKGYNGDAARTYLVGKVSDEKSELCAATRECFFRGLATLKDGTRLGDLGAAIQEYAEGLGYGVVRALVGHGIGQEMHEDPEVPNYGRRGRGMRLKAGMTIAIEPMINMGTYDVRQLSDGWTIVTADGKPSAHYENTVLITEDGAEVLSL